MSDERSSFETVIRWVVIVILALVALKVALIALGLAFGLAGLAWKLLPFVLLVWLVYKGIEWIREKNDPPTTSATDATDEI